MSEVSLYFDVGMFRVHKTIGKFNSVINECPGSVCTPLNTSTLGYHMRHLRSGSKSLRNKLFFNSISCLLGSVSSVLQLW